MQNKLLVATLTFSACIIALLMYRYDTVKSLTMPKKCIPAFIDGGGPYYQQDAPFREKISPDNSSGVPLTVEVKIFSSDCMTIVNNAILDIWQANETGNYQDEWYRGRVSANRHGVYKFTTVVPKGYGEGTAFRPPHIHFKVWLDSKDVITSQMFFPESKGKPGFEDAYIMDVSESNFFGKKMLKARHNIVLPL